MPRLTNQQRFEEQMMLRSRVREARDALARTAPPPWRFPALSDFTHYRWVLAFDATLTNCGWTWFMVTPEGVLVGARGTIRPRTSETGYLGTWDKARGLDEEVTPLIERHIRQVPLAALVVEAPSVGGGSRTESSLIAGMLVWRQDRGCAVVSATHVSAVLLGDPRCKSAERKKRIREAVIRLCPEASGRGWNEHERDALATGLAHLHDLGQAA
jgi:hypothetical protein